MRRPILLEFVPEDQVSLAISKDGQECSFNCSVTGWRLISIGKKMVAKENTD